MTTPYRQHYTGVLDSFEFNATSYNNLGAGYDPTIDGPDSGAITDMFQFDPEVVSQSVVVAPENLTTGPGQQVPIVVPPDTFAAYLAGRQF